MPIPDPKKGESQDDFMKRCMHAIRDDNRPQDQKVAICLRTFDDYGKANLLQVLNSAAEKFNPNHDDHGRFSSGGGSGDAPATGNRSAIERIAVLLGLTGVSVGVGAGIGAVLSSSAGPAVFSAIVAVLGYATVRDIVNRVRGKQITNTQNLFDELMQMTAEKRSEVLNEILSGLSEADAEAIMTAIGKSNLLQALDDAAEKFNRGGPGTGNPNHDDRGRFSSGGGGGGSGGGGGGSGGGGGAAAGGYGRRWEFIASGADKPAPFTSKWAEAWGSISEHLGRLATTFIRTFGTSLMAIIARKGASYVARALGIIGQPSDKATTNMTAQDLLAQAQELSDSGRGDLVNELLGGLDPEDVDAINAMLEDKSHEGTMETKSNSLNSAGSAHASTLISSGKVNKSAAWSFSAEDGNRLLGSSGDDWENYGQNFLGIDSAEDPKTKAHWKYPFAKGGFVFRSGLVAIRQRAGQQSDTGIFDAAGKLIDRIDGKSTMPAQARDAPVETKDFSFNVSSLNDSGTFEGYASTFGNVDFGGDKMVAGAFAKSLAAHEASGTAPLMLWSHDPRSPIGIWDDLKEDGDGLYAKGKLLIKQNVPDADKVHALLKAKAIRGLSIGYRVKDAEDDGDVRLLKDVELPEISVVSFPMNDRAKVSTVKSLSGDDYELLKRLRTFAQQLRDGDPLPIKEFEDLLRDVGIPKRMATHIVSVGYAKAIRSESGGDDEAKQLLARLEAAAGAFNT